MKNQISSTGDLLVEASPSRGWKVPFFTIWTGQAFSLFGSQLVQFALVWWLTQQTGSATALATATLVAILPQVLLGPLVGALVDRWNRRVTMMLADGLTAAAIVILALLFATGLVQVWHIYVIMFLRSIFSGFHWPAMQASTSLMVPEQHLARVQGLNQSLFGLMSIGSAPVAALLMEWLSIEGILMIDVSTAMLAILPLFFIAVPQPQRILDAQVSGAATTFWHDLKEGFRYVWAWPGLMLIGLMVTIINMLLTPASSLQPILVYNHFQGQALQLAWMESAMGIGMVVGGILLGMWGGFKRRIHTSLLGLVLLGFSLGSIGFVSPNYLWLAVVMMFLSGVATPIIDGPMLALAQAVVAPEMQGRVFTLMQSFASAMTPLGLLIAGPASDALGPQIWFIVGGITCVLLAIGALFVPAIVHLEEGKSIHTQARLGEQ